MNKDIYLTIEKYMLSCMRDSAHDKEHIYRVLYNALEIAKSEINVNMDVLICACLLHDIGRVEQYADPSLCHARIVGEKAYTFLLNNGFPLIFAERVRHCIQAHRYRANNIPQTIEAKILFDADKLDAAGAMGIARTLLYQGIVSDPLYSLQPDGSVSDGTDDEKSSFFREYKYKLEKVYDAFYTSRAAEIAAERQTAATAFYHSLLNEVADTYRLGQGHLEDIFEREQDENIYHVRQYEV